MSGAPANLAHVRELAERHGLPLDLCGRLALRPREVARALGVSLRSVEGWIASGRLATSKPDRIVLVPMADLLEFLERHRQRKPDPKAGVRERAAALIAGGRRIPGLG